MKTYGETNNCEISVMDFISASLEDSDWTGIRVAKSNEKVYGGTLPCIQVSIKNNIYKPLEIGGSGKIKSMFVDLKIFAVTDTQRQDLKDFLISAFASDPEYFEYEVDNGIVINKELRGHVVIEKIVADKRELENTSPEMISKEDRYRQLITFQSRISLI